MSTVHDKNMETLRTRLASIGELPIEKEAFEAMPPGMPPNTPEAAAAMPPPGMDPAAMGGAPMPPMDPAAMGGAPMPPAGTPVTLTLEDLQTVVQGIVAEAGAPAPEAAAETEAPAAEGTEAKLSALTDTVNAIAAAIGVDPALGAASAEGAPEGLPPEAAAMGPEEAAMLEAGGMPPMDPMAGGMPPVDPAVMGAAANQEVPVPVPEAAPMMQMTAAEYVESEKPETNKVAHMLINLQSRR